MPQPLPSKKHIATRAATHSSVNAGNAPWLPHVEGRLPARRESSGGGPSTMLLACTETDPGGHATESKNAREAPVRLLWSRSLHGNGGVWKTSACKHGCTTMHGE